MATIKDVSELAGVSQATVSRVVNGTTRVSHTKKLKVEKAIRELGYKLSAFGRTPSNTRTGSIGIIVPELGGPFYSEILDNIESTLSRYGYHTVVTSGQSSEHCQKESIEFLLGRRVDGLILLTPNLTDDYLINLENQGVPLVVLNRTIPEMPRSCINIDNELGSRSAIQYLIKQGHTSIACISGPLSEADARARLLGYRRALEEADIAYDEMLVCEGGYTETSGKTVMAKLLRRERGFTAVFACNDHMAFGAYETLREEGISVPKDISLIGFDNVNFARYLTPALTTVSFPIKEMCMEAVELMFQKLNKNQTQVRYRLLPSLVVRDSVAEKSLIHA